MLSYDPDVVATFKCLSDHMPEDSEDEHLFLCGIKDSRSKVWFKKGVNVSEGVIRHWMKAMAAEAGIKGDITNKTGRVTSITRMSLARVPVEVIQSVTGHKNVKSLARYDRTLIMKHKATQALNRCPYNPVTHEPYTFEHYYELEKKLWNANETGDILQVEAGGDEFDEDSEAEELAECLSGQVSLETGASKSTGISSVTTNPSSSSTPSSTTFGVGNYSGPGPIGGTSKNVYNFCTQNAASNAQAGYLGREHVIRVMNVNTSGSSGNNQNTGGQGMRDQENLDGQRRETSRHPVQRPLAEITHVYDANAPRVSIFPGHEYPESFGKMMDGYVRPQKFFHEGPVYRYPPDPTGSGRASSSRNSINSENQAGSAWLTNPDHRIHTGNNAPSILPVAMPPNSTQRPIDTNLRSDGRESLPSSNYDVGFRGRYPVQIPNQSLAGHHSGFHPSSNVGFGREGFGPSSNYHQSEYASPPYSRREVNGLDSFPVHGRRYFDVGSHTQQELQFSDFSGYSDPYVSSVAHSSIEYQSPIYGNASRPRSVLSPGSSFSMSSRGQFSQYAGQYSGGHHFVDSPHTPESRFTNLRESENFPSPRFTTESIGHRSLDGYNPSYVYDSTGIHDHVRGVGGQFSNLPYQPELRHSATSFGPVDASYGGNNGVYGPAFDGGPVYNGGQV